MKMETTLKEKVSEWVNRYTDDMYRYAFSQVSNQEMAEDIVQNVFVAAIESLDKLGNVDNPKSWLFSVLRNKISDHHRLSYRNQVDTTSNHFNGPEDNHFDKLLKPGILMSIAFSIIMNSTAYLIHALKPCLQTGITL